MSDTSASGLILWRHAEAHDAVPGKISDPQRPLTSYGLEQAARMAAWLNARIGPCRILVSPAIRTCQTAAALERAYKMDPWVGLRATPRTILAAAGWPGLSTNPCGLTIVVGHQPTLGETAALLLPELDMDWNLKRGAIVWIERGGPNNQGLLKLAMTPEDIKEA